MIDFSFYFYSRTKSLRNPLAWPPVLMPADSFPLFEVLFGIFKRFELACQRWFYEKNATINHVIAPECGAYKKNKKRQPSVHVQLNSTCTDSRQFSD